MIFLLHPGLRFLSSNPSVMNSITRTLTQAVVRPSHTSRHQIPSLLLVLQTLSLCAGKRDASDCNTTSHCKQSLHSLIICHLLPRPCGGRKISLTGHQYRLYLYATSTFSLSPLSPLSPPLFLSSLPHLHTHITGVSWWC